MVSMPLQLPLVAAVFVAALGVGARLLVLRGFLAYSSFREPRA